MIGEIFTHTTIERWLSVSKWAPRADDERSSPVGLPRNILGEGAWMGSVSQSNNKHSYNSNNNNNNNNSNKYPFRVEERDVPE